MPYPLPAIHALTPPLNTHPESDQLKAPSTGSWTAGAHSLTRSLFYPHAHRHLVPRPHPLAGTECIRLHCGHTWCRSCLGGFFTSRVVDGEVKGLKCPKVGCAADALPTEVKQVVSPEQYDSYEARLLEVCIATPKTVLVMHPIAPAQAHPRGHAHATART